RPTEEINWAMRARRAWPLVIVLLASLTGCAGTFSAVTPQGAAADRSPDPPKVLVIRDIRVTDPTWEPYKPSFSMGVREWIMKNGASLQVVTEPSPELPTDSIVLSGALTEVDNGSAALRFWVGMGAGQSKAR